MDAPVGPSPSAPFAVPNNASRFTDIVARERARLGSFIRRQVRNAADAEDILQEVLLEFYLASDAIEQAGAWLFRVAKNRIVDRARKKKEEPAAPPTSRSLAVTACRWRGTTRLTVTAPRVMAPASR